MDGEGAILSHRGFLGHRTRFKYSWLEVANYYHETISAANSQQQQQP